jgi:hypothetical protein
MSHIDGALARKLDFEDISTTLGTGRKAQIALTPGSDKLRGPDKYTVLAHQRHQAQIKARRLLDLL